MSVWSLLARRAGQVFGKALVGAMPRLANQLGRKRKFSRAVCRVTRDGGKTWTPWPGPGYGTGRE